VTSPEENAPRVTRFSVPKLILPAPPGFVIEPLDSDNVPTAAPADPTRWPHDIVPVVTRSLDPKEIEDVEDKMEDPEMLIFPTVADAAPVIPPPFEIWKLLPTFRLVDFIEPVVVRSLPPKLIAFAESVIDPSASVRRPNVDPLAP
jgi:hypothetical protein